MIGKPVQRSTTKPVRLGEVSTTSLEKGIGLINDYGSSRFFDNPKTIAEKYINQGVAALQLYHYLDAYRSFKEAEKNNPNLVMAYVGQIIAAVQIGSASSAFTVTSMDRLTDIQKSTKLTPVETAWLEFARAYEISNSKNYVKKSGENAMSLLDSYEEILKKDPTNIEGHGLITWFILSSLDINQAKEQFERILKIDPSNIGAHHSLLHLAESKNDMAKANIHATELSRLAPLSAHAQHMYGHTLPQRGLWREALDYFKKADELHQRWSEKNGLDTSQDWHYAHNMDLLASTYLGLGDFQSARIAWEKSKNDSRALLKSLALSIATESKETADIKLAIYERNGWAYFLRTLRAELNIAFQKDSLPELEKDSASKYNKLLVRLIKTNPEEEKNLGEDIKKYFIARFTSGGFDGWSNAYLEMLRLKRVASLLSKASTVQDIEILQMSVQSGSFCTSATKSESLTRCMPSN